MVIQELRLGALDVHLTTPKKRKATGGPSPGNKQSRTANNTSTLSSAGTSPVNAEIIKQEADDQVNSPSTPSKKMQNSTPSTTTRKGTLVFAIDFGMTNSAIAFADELADPTAVACLKRFPGSHEIQAKVPTVIAYQQENLEHDAFEGSADLESVFGFQAAEAQNRHAFFKLSLSNNSDATAFDDPMLKEDTSELLLRMSRGSVGHRAVVDSLFHLRDIGFRQARDRFGGDFLDKYKLRIVVTHPAAFSNDARKKLHNAVVASGFRSGIQDQIWLKSESESAAVAAYFDNCKTFGTDRWIEASKNRSGVTVLDMGGLTCDITTFLVKRGKPPLKLEQSCPPQGGNCGTVAMYCRLFKYLADLFGESFTSLPDNIIGHGSLLLWDFERELRVFDADPAKLNKFRRFRLPMAISGQPDLYDHLSRRVLVTGHSIKAMLDENLVYVKRIIEDQLIAHNKAHNQSPVTIFVLCGGGSNFPYMYSELRTFCRSLPMANFHAFIRPTDPLSAVVEGALMSSLKVRVLQKRTSEAAYGIKVHERYREGEWKQDDVFECAHGETRIDGFLTWHVRKGDLIDVSKPGSSRPVPVYSVLNLDDLNAPTQYQINIYGYKGDGSLPNRVEADGVYVQGYFLVKPSEMSVFMKTTLRKKYEDSPSSMIEMTIVQLVGSDSGLIEFEARVGNTVIGRYELEDE